ncbi:50S ribosomal protein L17 [Candidatus Shapirobacteria bacterium CG03_land_8_20_14_0_80_39_12]|uniref:50S ribosomal protein L17 n=1 Tax=Candidatus Shapirobacteria bacterium CG03_land_8_20_14_0_80_39_12 TaxID=1974879 RepID=A0A2M7BEM2_9BACT|nr:MAG: 50S ribosomal protein L17 [Candidatus Shapirobacteria bacterium CG03_land_8_20_14_0_80_39_12]
MRKQVFGRQFSRTKHQRLALFRGLISSLVEKGEVITTLPKAKAIKGQVEKLITKAKAGTLNDKRIILRFLTKRSLVNKLVLGIAPLFKEKTGGYLRIIKLGQRKGDTAPMAQISFTEDFNKIVLKTVKEVKKEAVEEVKKK